MTWLVMFLLTIRCRRSRRFGHPRRPRGQVPRDRHSGLEPRHPSFPALHQPIAPFICRRPFTQRIHRSLLCPGATEVIRFLHPLWPPGGIAVEQTTGVSCGDSRDQSPFGTRWRSTSCHACSRSEVRRVYSTVMSLAHQTVVCTPRMMSGNTRHSPHC